MLKKLISILGGYGKYQEYPSLKTSFAFGTQSLAPPNPVSYTHLTLPTTPYV